MNRCLGISLILNKVFYPHSNSIHWDWRERLRKISTYFGYWMSILNLMIIIMKRLESNTCSHTRVKRMSGMSFRWFYGFASTKTNSIFRVTYSLNCLLICIHEHCCVPRLNLLYIYRFYISIIHRGSWSSSFCFDHLFTIVSSKYSENFPFKTECIEFKLKSQLKHFFSCTIRNCSRREH